MLRETRSYQSIVHSYQGVRNEALMGFVVILRSKATKDLPELE
jgi:hypothetical protein